MYANWVPSPPYVIESSTGSEPRGLIPELIAHMLQESCGACFNYKMWNISYAINATESITELDSRVKVDFRFPIRSAVGRTTYRGFHSYVPLITVPGVALMTRKKTPSGYARDLGYSVLGCWSIFAVSIALAILMGVIIWFAVSSLIKVSCNRYLSMSRSSENLSACVRKRALAKICFILASNFTFFIRFKIINI